MLVISLLTISVKRLEEVAELCFCEDIIFINIWPHEKHGEGSLSDNLQQNIYVFVHVLKIFLFVND